MKTQRRIYTIPVVTVIKVNCGIMLTHSDPTGGAGEDDNVIFESKTFTNKAYEKVSVL